MIGVAINFLFPLYFPNIQSLICNTYILKKRDLKSCFNLLNCFEQPRLVYNLITLITSHSDVQHVQTGSIHRDKDIVWVEDSRDPH